MNWGFWIRRGAALGVVGLLLAGCSNGDDGAGTVSPDVSATAVPSPDVSAGPPVLPSAKPTPASAVAFVRYFWGTYNYAYATYDTRPLEAISKSTCRYCSSTLADVRRIADARTQIKDHVVTVTEAVSPDAVIKTGTLVVSTSNQSPGRAVSPSGGATKLAGKKNTKFTFSLAWKSGRWQVEGVDFDPMSGTPWNG